VGGAAPLVRGRRLAVWAGSGSVGDVARSTCGVRTQNWPPCA